MAFDPKPVKEGDVIQSGAWNEAMEEIKRLGKGGDGGFVKKSGDTMTGKLGIGTDPKQELDVKGAIRIDSCGGLISGRPKGNFGGKQLIMQVADNAPQPNDEIWIGHNNWVGQIQLCGKKIWLTTGGGTVTVAGTLAVQGAKNFDIAHPSEPGQRLVHAAIEGPEAAVYYRGEATLADGRHEIRLPPYFEALTRKEGRTVQLTPIGAEPFRLSATRVVDGSFTVFGERPEGAFFWEVKAVRADIPPIVVERPEDPDERTALG